jgi:hypothetical protein
VSKSKAKGTNFETLIKQYFIDQGFDADRQVLSGSKDVGDIKVWKVDSVFELKNCVKLNLSGWLAETEIERINAGKRWGFTIFKRKGKGKAEQQYCLMTVGQLAEILAELFPESRSQ